MKRVILALSITLVIALVFGLAYFQWASSQPSVVGVWKATDEHGNEYYWEFHEDGTLISWDRNRESDGSFTKSSLARGSFNYENRKTVTTKTNGWLPESMGTLTLVSENELKQDGGWIMRKNLVYRRVGEE